MRKLEWGAQGSLGMSGTWAYVILEDDDGGRHRFDWEDEPGFIAWYEEELRRGNEHESD